MADDRKRCWLMEGCPSMTGVCYSCVPDGDDCPIWRWFKKQIVVRCKECKHATMTSDGKMCKYCAMDTDDFGDQRNVYHDADWFCADGERKEVK